MSSKLTTTKNYALFELLPFNRDVRRLKPLESSMKKHGFIPAYPLHCVKNGNGKLRIKAGHHRFEVAKKLGLPVSYVVCSDDATVHELEHGTTPWALKDFLSSYCRIGSEPHKIIQCYVDTTGMSIGQVSSMLGGECASSNNLVGKVKSDTFQIKSTEHIDAVAHVVLGLKKMGVQFATSRNLVSALSLLVFLPEFDAEIFLHRVAVNTGMMMRQAKVVDYLAMIETIYNRQAKNKVALAFLAKEAARQRAVAKPK